MVNPFNFLYYLETLKMVLKNGLIWGGILGVALVIGTQILTWCDLGTSNWYIIMTYLLVAIASIGCVRQLRYKLKDGFGFLKAILSILVMIIISRYIFQAYMYIYIHYIDPAWINTVSDTWAAMLAEKNMSADKIDKQISTFRRSYDTINMFTVEIVFIGLSQFILGCIVAGIYKWRTG